MRPPCCLQAVAARDSAAALAESREGEVTRLLGVVADLRRDDSILKARLVSVGDHQSYRLLGVSGYRFRVLRRNVNCLRPLMGIPSPPGLLCFRMHPAPWIVHAGSTSHD